MSRHQFKEIVNKQKDQTEKTMGKKSNKIKRKILQITMVIIITTITMNTKQPLKAQELNICKAILEDTFIEAVTTKVLECKDFTALECLTVVPADCCVPTLCLANPVCTFLKIIEEAAAYWQYEGEIYCDGSEISADQFVEKWLNEEIASLTNIALGFLPDTVLSVVNSQIDIIAQQGSYLPSHVQTQLHDIIELVYDHGETGFAHGDYQTVKIINENRNSLTKLYMNKGAITLGPVVIFKDEDYDNIMDTANNFSLQELLNGKGGPEYSQSLEILLHELVHVKQYRELGQNTFILNYLMNHFPLIGDEYGFDEFEQEAYRFSAEMSEQLGGQYCIDVQETQNYYIDLFDIDMNPIVCGVNTTLCNPAPCKGPNSCINMNNGGCLLECVDY